MESSTWIGGWKKEFEDETPSSKRGRGSEEKKMPFVQSRAVVNSVNSDGRGWEVGFKPGYASRALSLTVVPCFVAFLGGKMSCWCIRVSIPGWISERGRI